MVSIGSDWRSHRLIPSRDIEGAVMKFIDAKPQSTTHSNKGTLPAVSANIASNMANSPLSFHNTAIADRSIPRSL